jgi:hypothetical protein
LSDFHASQPFQRRIANDGIISGSDGHQTLTDICPCTDPHAQPVARILMDDAPISFHEAAPGGLRDVVNVEFLTVLAAIDDSSRGRGESA